MESLIVQAWQLRDSLSAARHKPVSSTFTVMKAGTRKQLCCLSFRTWQNVSVFHREATISLLRLHRVWDGKLILNNSWGNQNGFISFKCLSPKFKQGQKRRGGSTWNGETSGQNRKTKESLFIKVFKKISITPRHSNSASKHFCHDGKCQVFSLYTLRCPHELFVSR